MAKFVAIVRRCHPAAGGPAIITRYDLTAPNELQAIQELDRDYHHELGMIGDRLWMSWKDEGRSVLYLIGI